MDIFSNNRDRSYSRDSVPYASESSSSSTSGPNRERADTGDSTLSSDTNASTLSMGGPRRRSHRPRGCRGGRKNRKKKNKVPDEIVGPTSVLSKDTQSFIPGVCQSPHPNQGDRNTPSSSANFPPLHASGFQHHGGCHHSHVLSQPSMQQQHVYPQLDNNVAILNSTSAYSNNNNNNNNNTAYMLDSRPTEDINRNLYHSNLATISVQGPVPTLEGILPPPPSVPNAVENIARGPNPYALTKQPSQPLSNAPSSSFGVLATVETFASNENRGYPPKLNVIQKPMTGLQVKTSNIAAIGGQSLFAISPRSFLTGAQGNTVQTEQTN